VFNAPVRFSDGGRFRDFVDPATFHVEEAIDRAIQSLPEKQRMAVVLRRHEEMPYEEIAVVLEMSIPAVKSLLFRARAQLKEALQRYLEA
jgi:RNA polymerase sigma-70 factor (ECF subfamily)